MFEQLIEFTFNHYLLVGTFVFLLVAFFVNESRQGGATVSPSELVQLMNRDEAVVLDVRDMKDFGEGHIIDAINIPSSAVESRVQELEKYRDHPLVIVCKMGQHSGAIGKRLRALGFSKIQRLSGGVAEWRAANFPLVKS